MNPVLADYGQQIEELAKPRRYEKPVQALTCYKGIKHIFALTMITEIGDIKRFPHPRQLTSWIGMDVREYSSGGKHHRFGITKFGNRYLRTAFIEANQRGYRTTRISKFKLPYISGADLVDCRATKTRATTCLSG